MRPDFADSWAYLGEALQHIPSGQALPAQPKDDALQALEKALSLAPASVSANSFLALYYQRQDAPGQAFPYLQTAIRSDSDNPTLLAMLGAILASQGDLPGALAAYQKAIGLAPREPTFMKLLALFTIKYKYQPAETGLLAASEAVQLNPKDVEGLDILGQVFLQLNDPENAKLTLRRAIQLDPAYAPAYLHLGMAAYQVGDYAGAAANLEQAQSLAPGSPIADQAQRLLEIYLP
jgi:protein O-GlcNAc transferase